MKKEALEAAKAAYKIESECIKEAAEFFDEEAYGKAVDLFGNNPVSNPVGSVVGA